MAENKFAMSLRLNLDKPREARLKEYLDRNADEGINRKEAILRMFEDMERKTERVLSADISKSVNKSDHGDKNDNSKKDGFSLNELNFEADSGDFDI